MFLIKKFERLKNSKNILNFFFFIIKFLGKKILGI